MVISSNESDVYLDMKTGTVVPNRVDVDSLLVLESVPVNPSSSTSGLSKEEIENCDDHLYCEDCEDYYMGSCAKHPFLWVKDVKVDATPKPLVNGEIGVPKSRSHRTLPDFFVVRTSNIPDAGLGVFTQLDIPSGVVFGPYEGVLLTEREEADKSGYAWEVRTNDVNQSRFIDGSDPERSNWLRFVNSSRHEAEQNLLAFQLKGAIYYRVFKLISAGSELLVWYGKSYGKRLGAFHPTKTFITRLRRNPFILS